MISIISITSMKILPRNLYRHVLLYLHTNTPFNAISLLRKRKSEIHSQRYRFKFLKLLEI